MGAKNTQQKCNLVDQNKQQNHIFGVYFSASTLTQSKHNSVLIKKQSNHISIKTVFFK